MTGRESAATRWLGAGSSTATDAACAGAEAAGGALAGRDPALLIVFASNSYDLGTLVASVNKVSGGAPLVGCSTAGEIAIAGPQDAGVVVMALGGSGFSVNTGMGSGPLRQAGRDAAAYISGVAELPHMVLV